MENSDPSRAIDTPPVVGKNPGLPLPQSPTKRPMKLLKSRFLLPSSLLALAMTLGLGGCQRPEPWNVLLVTFDTTRADHLACYGHDGIRTPNVDALAAEGVLFEQAYAAAPVTTPSHSTILTGKYPIAHGVRDNGLFVLPDSQQTLAEILGEAGWATGAAIGAFPLVRKFGLDQGFDHYDDAINPPTDNFLADRSLPKSRLYFDERRAARVNEALDPWLEQHHADPFFAWVHYYDPHQPFDPPTPYDQLYAGRPYEGEIAYADEVFGQLLDRLRQLGVYDRTIVVLTADHGEGRGEHGELTHSVQIYNTTLHVPLIVHVPGTEGGRRIGAPVSSVDIVPTVLDLLGLPIPDDVQGQSLAPILRGEAGAEGDETLARRPLYAETLAPRLGFGWGELRALMRGDRKLIYGPRPELYDLGADPDELHDLIDTETETAERMEAELARFLAENAAQDLDAAVEMDEETRQKLMALGYIGGGGGVGDVIVEELRRDGVPPQDRVGDISDLSLAKQLISNRQPLRAREVVARLLEGHAENPTYLEMMATVDLQLGRLDAALETIERVRGLESASGVADRLLLPVGTLLFYRGEYDRAEAVLGQSLEREANAVAHYLLANIHSARGDREAERSALEAALALDPTYASARVDLAIRHAQAGDREQAEVELRRAMADQPYFAKTFYNFGAFLVEGGQLEEAVPQFQRAVELRPDYWQAYFALVSLHLALEQPEEAARHFRTLESRAPRSPETERARVLIGQEAGHESGQESQGEAS